MGFEKIIDLGGCTDGWGPEYVPVHSQTLTKVASACYTPDSLVEVMSKLRPRPEGRYILLNALGAHEYWGVNRNGDAFPEWSLRGDAPPKEVLDIIKHKIKPKLPMFQVPTGRYGHKTFVDFAHVYVGHVNNDPAKSIGDVIASAYNEKMHRVELIIFVYKDRNPELIQKIDAGEPVPFSMGAKLVTDTCSICLNCARTRAEYCEHLTSLMGRSMPDGRRVFAYNFFPRFFDISYVTTPADRSAWGLKKVASTGLSQAVLPSKTNFDKLADMVKEEPAVGKSLGSAPVDPKVLSFIMSKARDKYQGCAPDPALVKAVEGYKLKKVLASMTSMGMLLKPVEVTKLSSSCPGDFPDSFTLDDVDRKVVRALEPFIEKRSFHDPFFSKEASAPAESRTNPGSGSEAFTQYCSYLTSIDFSKLAEWVDTSPVAQVSLNFDSCLFKVAGVNPTNQPDRPWLPFVAAASRFNPLLTH